MNIIAKITTLLLVVKLGWLNNQAIREESIAISTINSALNIPILSLTLSSLLKIAQSLISTILQVNIFSH